jgi:hypothetical protein
VVFVVVLGGEPLHWLLTPGTNIGHRYLFYDYGGTLVSKDTTYGK